MLAVETQVFSDDRESVVIRTVEVEFGVSDEEEEREEGEEREVGFSGHFGGPAGSGGAWWWELKNWLVVSYINWVLAVERGAADKTTRQVGPFGAKFSFPRSWSKILIFCLKTFFFF